MSLSKVLPEDYGLVVMTGAGSIFVNMWHAMNVANARKKFEVPYPLTYSSVNNGENQFNCIQRSHQNFLENYPPFLMLLFLGGLQYPKISAGMGTVYLVGRIVYALGYNTGDPDKRKRGGFLHIAEMVMLGSTIMLGYNLIKDHGMFWKR
ncbi:microsomal glutathione S-transferase 3-like [Lingula anatina]|uniref:Glutathione S-transferase 3, mitochondrial n=1 Tax=Lingula anatina TaxID=7574 RepID=A0A1S3HPL0_LINAN|nr:microsomal glutathione S-transferase 3-like [Lingula anatina]|eukprot:XP_013386974.1 microsomal glutathione S-transferase 3-like [Lingula anatina]